jgi:hypothetical protein
LLPQMSVAVPAAQWRARRCPWTGARALSPRRPWSRSAGHGPWSRSSGDEGMRVFCRPVIFAVPVAALARIEVESHDCRPAAVRSPAVSGPSPRARGRKLTGPRGHAQSWQIQLCKLRTADVLSVVGTHGSVCTVARCRSPRKILWFSTKRCRRGPKRYPNVPQEQAQGSFEARE